MPHDTLAFTQGLLMHGGRLYESTGSPAGHTSSLRQIDPATGAVIGQQAVPQVFAEGIAALKGTLYQLTWREGLALARALPGLNPIIAQYSYEGEGWGLTADGKRLIMSNGSDTLYWRDTDLRMTRALPVTMAGKPLRQLNELEYANGAVFANVWYSIYIFRIDPASGAVTRVYDCQALAAQAGVDASQKVLNGIAFDPATGHFYVTGKDWPRLFEVTLP